MAWLDQRSVTSAQVQTLIYIAIYLSIAYESITYFGIIGFNLQDNDFENLSKIKEEGKMSVNWVIIIAKVAKYRPHTQQKQTLPAFNNKCSEIWILYQRQLDEKIEMSKCQLKQEKMRTIFPVVKKSTHYSNLNAENEKIIQISSLIEICFVFGH